uniref:Trace amine associated receptor 2 (gene/pseudogene) n=1 Tax=Cyanistes caeruleus TaxID=156563 RepID=A0A8C0USY0_CYACU
MYPFNLKNSNFRSARTGEVMYLFITAVFILTVFGNLAIIISILYFKQLHSPTNFLILSMAVTDLLLGFALMPYSMVRSVEKCWVFGIIFCKVHYSFDLMLSSASIFHLCSIAMDGFCAICHPLHYCSTMTVAAIKQIMSVCWSVPAAFAFSMLIKCSGLCPIVFNKPGGGGAFLLTFSKNKDRKAVKTLSIFMLSFLICCFPCFFAVLIDPFFNFSIPLPLFDSLNCLGYLNSF